MTLQRLGAAPLRTVLFDHIPLLLAAHQCLNRGYRQAGCTRCVQACPTRAIDLHDGAPALDGAACVDCGACLPVCPTGVFSQRVSPEELLVQAAGQTAGAGRVAVACPVHPDPAASQAPVDRVLRHSRCLASLDVDHLLALSRSGQRDVWLDDTPCAGCSIGQAQGRILVAVQAANALLQGFDRPGRIRTTSQNTDLLAHREARLPVTQALLGSLARREIFARLKRYGEEAVGQANARQAAEARVPAARQRLLRQVQSWPAASEAVLAVEATPLAALQVDGDACSACGLCVTLCPTAALRLDVTAAPGEWRLAFQPATCVDCGICALACPEHAVSYGELLPAAALGGDEMALAGGRLTSCVDCGLAVAVRPQQPARCYACRQGAGRANPMADTAGLMADLLQRLS